MSCNRSLKRKKQRKTFVRGDYRQCTENTLALLGSAPSNFFYHKPGATSSARWMGKVLYRQKMFMINCVPDLDLNCLYLQTFYLSLNVAATSTSNKKLNFTVNKCNKLASCSVSKHTNEDENFFIFCLPTTKLTHKKRKAKQATHIIRSWFKKSITVGGTALKRLK